MCKDSANRGQNKTNSFVFYAEVPPFLWKDSARWCVFYLHILMKEYIFA